MYDKKIRGFKTSTPCLTSEKLVDTDEKSNYDTVNIGKLCTVTEEKKLLFLS